MTSNTMRVILRALAGSRRLRVPLEKRLTAILSTSHPSAPTGSSIHSGRQSFHEYQRESPRLDPRKLCLAGMLAFLGLEKPEEDPIVTSIKRGVLAMQKEEYNKAEQFLHIALKMSQDKLDENSVTYCYDILANIAYRRGDYPKAERLFVETMKRIMQRGALPDDNAIVEMSLKIANMSSRQNEHKKAELGFKYCIDCQRKKIAAMSAEENEDSGLSKDTHVLLGFSLDQYAEHLLKRGRYLEAQKMWSEALSISRKFLGHHHEQSIVIYSNIALAHERLGQIDESIKILEEIVSLKEMEESENLSIYLCNLGMNYITQNNFERAEKAFARAEKLAKKSGNKEILKEIEEYLTILRIKKEEKAS